MKLSECVKECGFYKMVWRNHSQNEAEQVEVKSLAFDSRSVDKGALFFCLVGEKDGGEFALQAVERGAVGVVCERELELDIPQIIVPSSREALSLISANFFNNPSKHLKIIGITGTNGKTTTSYMLASILRGAGKRVGIIGTLGIFYDGKKIPPELTTPDPVFLQETFSDMAKSGVEYVVMEVSAHALHYEKVYGIRFTACIFTNLSQDHLDFFGTMDNYKTAKKKLFQKSRTDLVVLNGDDPVGREIGKEAQKEGIAVYYYGLETPCDYFAVITDESIDKTDCMLDLSDKPIRIDVSLPGRHNVYNALASATTAYLLGISDYAIRQGLKMLKGVDGRIEQVAKLHGGTIFVDFAHTPDGIGQTLRSLRKFCTGKLICVFGCGGDRDKKKRPLMGEMAAKTADFSVLTSDNPRFEDPLDILAEIETGYRRFSKEYVVVSDRKQAIVYAMEQLEAGDVLAVLGKGGEQYQEIMGIKYEFCDKDFIKETVRRYSES